jgi:hypothetical protein
MCQWLRTKGQKAATLPTMWMNETIWVGTWVPESCVVLPYGTRHEVDRASSLKGPRCSPLKGSRNIVLPLRDGPPSLVDSTAQSPDLCHIQPSTSNQVRKSAGCEGCEVGPSGYLGLSRVILNPKNPSVGIDDRRNLRPPADPYILDCSPVYLGRSFDVAN